MNTACDALALRTISYDSLLEKARAWRLSGRTELLQEAEALLEELRRRYPLALQVGQEYVQVLLELGKTEKAHAVLAEVSGLLRHPHEEILCRWGRLYKEAGDAAHSRLATNPHRANADLADHYYRLALGKYDEAFRVRSGHYPGINKATLLLLRAALARERGQEEDAARLQRQAVALAQELLVRRDRWPDDEPDDRTVWHPATEAEALLLQRDWPAAARRYRTLQEQPAFRPAHLATIRRQVERILDCHRTLGAPDLGPFDDLDNVLGVKVSV